MTAEETLHDLPDLEAMSAFGTRIASRLKAGDVVELKGELGAGKSTLARGILAALGHQGDVPSPTFTLIELYRSETMPIAVAHADFYRLNHPDEALELGIDDYREGAALLAEWPERAGGFAHEPACLTITLEIADEGRHAIARGGPDWLGRMP